MRFFRVLSIEYVTDTVSLHSPRLHPPPPAVVRRPASETSIAKIDSDGIHPAAAPSPASRSPRRRRHRSRLAAVDAARRSRNPLPIVRRASARERPIARARSRAFATRRRIAMRCADSRASSRVFARRATRSRSRARASARDRNRRTFVGALGCGRAFQTRLCAVVASRAGLARAGDKTQISRLVM